jgi:hypothetical protein
VQNYFGTGWKTVLERPRKKIFIYVRNIFSSAGISEFVKITLTSFKQGTLSTKGF